MGAKKVEKSLGTLKTDIRELTEAFWALRDEIMTQEAGSAAERHAGRARRSPFSPPPNGKAPTEGSAGYVEANGMYSLPAEAGKGQLLRWRVENVQIEEILSPPVDEAARLLGAIGHRQRLRILLLLLRAPATATDLVRELSLGTTGAAYHHLNVLQGAGLVAQEQRGTFSVVPNAVPGLLSILTGLSGAIEVAGDEAQAMETVVAQDEDA